jgi:hypothetical protein
VAWDVATPNRLPVFHTIIGKGRGLENWHGVGVVFIVPIGGMNRYCVTF